MFFGDENQSPFSIWVEIEDPDDYKSIWLLAKKGKIQTMSERRHQTEYKHNTTTTTTTTNNNSTCIIYWLGGIHQAYYYEQYQQQQYIQIYR